MIDINIKGLPAFKSAILQFPRTLENELKTAGQLGAMVVIPELAKYPSPTTPKRGRKPYHRTGTLGRLWTSATPEWRAVGGGFETRIGNNTPYGKWVQGDDTQAGVHQDRWATTGQALKKKEGVIMGYANAALSRAIKRVSTGGG